MGGVLIKNCTAVPLKIQLCQVGVLYHDLVQPGEVFARETGAVHFTICATFSDKDDTSWTDTVLPVVGVVVGSLAALATAGASLGVFSGVAGASALPGLVTGAVTSAAEGGIVATGGAVLTRELAQKLFQQAEKSHYYISSAGWYFGGRNELEIRGGPRIKADSEGFNYCGSPLYIVNKNDRNRHS